MFIPCRWPLSLFIIIHKGLLLYVQDILVMQLTLGCILMPKLDKQQQNSGIDDIKGIENRESEENNNNKKQLNQESRRFKIKKGLKIRLDCEFCKGPISASPHVYKFATYERFFCCKGCMSGYKQKYAGRIESIKRRFKERDN